MADQIKELEKSMELIKKYQEYIDQLAKRTKSTDRINAQIAAEKALGEELKKNAELSKKVAEEKAKEAQEAQRNAAVFESLAQRASDSEKEKAEDQAKNRNKMAEAAIKEATAAKNAADTADAALTKNIRTIQKLRNERATASKDVIGMFDILNQSSTEAMKLVDNLYGDLRKQENETKAKEKQKIEENITLLKGKEKLTALEATTLKELEGQLRVLNEIEKKEKSKQMAYENYVKIINTGSKMSTTIVSDLLKFTSLGSKDKKEESLKLSTSVNTNIIPEKTEDKGDGDSNILTENNSTVLTSNSPISSESASASSAPNMGEESGDETPLTEDEKAENLKKNHEDRLNSAIEYAEAAKEVATELDSFLDAIDQERLRKKQDQYDQDLAALDAQLASGQITEEGYAEQKLALDKKLAADKAKIEREQAIRKKAMGVFQVGIDTAIGIMKAWTDVPTFASIAMTVLIAAMGAAQIAAIIAAPLPQARKGGLINGNSHENGGVIIEAEGGEAILSRDAVAMFPGMAQLMNVAAANDGIQDGGYAARSIMGSGGDGTIRSNSITCDIDYKKLSAAIAENLKEMKIYLAITDLNDGLKQYVQVEEMAKS